MPDPVDAHQLMATLRGQLHALNEIVAQCATDSLVHPIDYYEEPTAPSVIETGRVTGEAATHIAMDAFRNLSKARTQYPGSVLRIPGVIEVDKQLTGLVDKVNNQKDQIKQFVHDRYPNPLSRNRFTRANFPGRVMLQVYRHITCLTDVRKLTFTWAPASFSSKKLTRYQALELLNKRNVSGLDHLTENNFNALTMAIDEVQNSPPQTLYKIRKPRPPFPLANIHYYNNKIDQRNVSIPFIIYNDKQPLDIVELPTYDENNKRINTRTDKQRHSLVFKPLYLHRKL